MNRPSLSALAVILLGAGAFAADSFAERLQAARRRLQAAMALSSVAVNEAGVGLSVPPSAAAGQAAAREAESRILLAEEAARGGHPEQAEAELDRALKALERAEGGAPAAPAGTPARPGMLLIVTRGAAELRERMKACDLVVYGTVVKVGDVPFVQNADSPSSDPKWKDAFVEVAETLVGPADKTIVVRFPSAPGWEEWPKFAVGDKAVFLLGKDAVSGHDSMSQLQGPVIGGKRAQVYITGRTDATQMVFPASRLDELKAILK